MENCLPYQYGYNARIQGKNFWCELLNFENSEDLQRVRDGWVDADYDLYVNSQEEYWNERGNDE